MNHFVNRANDVVEAFKEVILKDHSIGPEEVDAIETEVYHIMLAKLLKKHRGKLNHGLCVDRESYCDAYVFFAPSFTKDSLLSEKDPTWYPFYLDPDFKEPLT